MNTFITIVGVLVLLEAALCVTVIGCLTVDLVKMLKG